MMLDDTLALLQPAGKGESERWRPVRTVAGQRLTGVDEETAAWRPSTALGPARSERPGL
jgi:hypothetical protein